MTVGAGELGNQEGCLYGAMALVAFLVLIVASMFVEHFLWH